MKKNGRFTHVWSNAKSSLETVGSFVIFAWEIEKNTQSALNVRIYSLPRIHPGRFYVQLFNLLVNIAAKEIGPKKNRPTLYHQPAHWNLREKVYLLTWTVKSKRLTWRPVEFGKSARRDACTFHASTATLWEWSKLDFDKTRSCTI